MPAQSHYLWIPSRFITIVGDFGIPMYDLVTAAAIIVGILLWFLSLRISGIPLWKQWLALGIIGICAVVFGRGFHILFWSFEHYVRMPTLMLRFTLGRSVHGVIFGFALAAVIISRWWGWPVSSITDRLVFWLLPGLALARIGNFWNSESIGTPTELPWAIRFYYAGDHGTIPRHPVQLYEAMAAVILLLVVLKQHGALLSRPWRATAIALTGIGLSRIAFDFIKQDPGYLLGETLSTGQWLSLPCIAVGVWLMWRSRNELS